ncbi:MAG: cation diffusion facilitator family transporter [Clostridia bacterium]|nr:cation diffusion facilitator family transporter [Clostridia bacterium]
MKFQSSCILSPEITNTKDVSTNLTLGRDVVDRFVLTKRIAILGIISNIVLLIFKLFIGFISRSQAMIADGFNSAGDVFASAMTYIGNKIASRPEDQDHPYGHGKAEYIFSMIISFSLVLVAYKIFTGSLMSVIHQETFLFSPALVAVAVLTILTKLALFLYTRKAGKKENNLLILANAEDHRNDVFVTSSTLLGIYLGRQGLTWADGVVGIGISLWIAFTGFRIFKSAYHVLMDTSDDSKLTETVVQAVEAIEGVDHVDRVITKPVGVGYIIIVKVSVLGELMVHEGHSIAAEIRTRVRKCKQVKDVVVHVNPA